MNMDRSDLVPNHAFNQWLQERAADFTIELLRGDWFERFGADAYRAVCRGGPRSRDERLVLEGYAKAVERMLREDECWPSRSASGKGKEPVRFARANELNFASETSLDDFLDDSRYLHATLCNSQETKELAKEYGVKALLKLSCVS